MDAISKTFSWGMTIKSIASFSGKFFKKLVTLATVVFVLAVVISSSVVLDGSYISVITMRISILCHFRYLLILPRTCWGYTSNVSELGALVPFYLEGIQHIKRINM